MGKLGWIAAIAVTAFLVRRALGGVADPLIPPTTLETQVMRHGGLIWRIGVKYDVEPALIAAIMAVESSGLHQPARPIDVTGYGGLPGTDYVVGLMQIRLDTANLYCDVSTWSIEGLEPDGANVECAVNYLRMLLDRFGLVDRAVSAYNAGPASVSVDPSVPMAFANIGYVRRVLGMIPRFRILFMSRQGGNRYLELFPGLKWRYETP